MMKITHDSLPVSVISLIFILAGALVSSNWNNEKIQLGSSFPCGKYLSNETLAGAAESNLLIISSLVLPLLPAVFLKNPHDIWSMAKPHLLGQSVIFGSSELIANRVQYTSPNFIEFCNISTRQCLSRRNQERWFLPEIIKMTKDIELYDGNETLTTTTTTTTTTPATIYREADKVLCPNPNGSRKEMYNSIHYFPSNVIAMSSASLFALFAAYKILEPIYQQHELCGTYTKFLIPSYFILVTVFYFIFACRYMYSYVSNTSVYACIFSVFEGMCLQLAILYFNSKFSNQCKKDEKQTATFADPNVDPMTAV
jgi:hypothetical protein